MKRKLIWLALWAVCPWLVAVEAQTYEPYTFTTVAGLAPGATDGTGSIARFFQPEGVAVDGAENVYVADTRNHTIRKTTPAGAVTTLAGRAGTWGNLDGAGNVARFYQPKGVAVDSAGNVYVSDSLHTIRKITTDGVVSTLAGTSFTGGSADGTGSAAQFNFPRGVSVDGGGNIYVADSSNHTIRKITPAGVVTTLAGLAGSSGSADGIGSAARFRVPAGVAADGAGNVYVADLGNYTIRRISPTGAVRTVAGVPGSYGTADGIGSTARFGSAERLTMGVAGDVFVADTSNHTVRRVTPEGVVTTVAGRANEQGSADGQANAARFFRPAAVAVDNAGNILVADTANSTIRLITPTGAVSTFAGTASPGSVDGAGSVARFYEPTGAATDTGGNIYIADQSNNTIRKVTPTGIVTTFAGMVGAYGGDDGMGSAARFSYPVGVALDGNRNAFVAESGGSTIRKITPAGEVTTFAGLYASPGSQDGMGNAARFSYPRAVATDAAGTVYVADTYNHTIRKITPAGVVSTLAGLAGSADGQGSAARFYAPHGLAVDASGNIYVSDTNNYTIRRITPGGEVSTLAGSVGVYGSSDGIGNAARFYLPRGMGADAAGNIYVVDSGNGTVRKLTAAGVVTTVAGRPDIFSAGSTDGPGSMARFSSPEGIAIDASGRIYVADTRNNAVRVGLPSAPPPNDSFDNASVLNGASGTLESNNVAATVEPGEPPHAGYAGSHSVWFSWTAPQSGVFSFQLSNSSFSTLLAIYTGSQVNGLTLVASAPFNQVALVRATAGTTYRIAVDGSNGGSGGFTLTWSLRTDGPANDDFVNAQALAGTSGSVAGTTDLATVEPGEPIHAGISGHHSIWFTWTAPQDGRFVFDNAGSAYGTVLAIYTGSVVDALTLVGESGLYYGTSRVNFMATAGATYRIALDTENANSYGPTVLNWRAADPPPNDNFADAQEIAGSAGSVAGSNVDASKEPGEPVHNFNSGGTSIWYKWTAPATGRFQFDVTGSFFDLGAAQLGIYSGSAVDNLRGLARSSSRVQFNAVEGGVYHLAVDGSLGDIAGDLVLRWQTLPSPQRTYQPYTFRALAGVSPGNVDGNGSSARFNRVEAAALGPDGNLYLADTYNHTIRKMTPQGTVTTFAGSPGDRGSTDGTGAAARFYLPSGTAVGPDGFVYVADSANNALRKISPTGVVSTLAGSPGNFGTLDGPGSTALFDFPAGLAVDESGMIFVADSYNHTIRRVTPGGEVSTVAGLAGTNGSSDGTGATARFSSPAGLQVDGSGNIYVADQSNYTIRKITPGGVVSTFAGSAGVYGSNDGVGSAATFADVNGLAFDGSGNLYVADRGNSRIRKITPGAAVTTLAGGGTAPGSEDGTGAAARFRYPSGIAATAAGELYVADTDNLTVRYIDTAAAVTTLAGQVSAGADDGIGEAARFRSTFSVGVGVDGDGNSYVADTGNHTIRKITPAGLTSVLAGLSGVSGTLDGTGSAARFRSPRGVAVGPDGNVYVADTSGNTIRKITPAGVVTTIAGAASQGSADGTGTAARFRCRRYPRRLRRCPQKFAPALSNQLIRKISSAAVVSTVAGSSRQYGSRNGAGSDVRFDNPTGIAAGPGGKLYVVDVNNAIRTGAPSLLFTSAVSRKTHGTAGTFDLDLPLTGTPAVESGNGVHSITVSYSNALTGGSATVSSGAGSVSGTAVTGNTITVTLTGVADRQTITVTLSDVTDFFGQTMPPLDVRMNVLFGDSNGNGAVNASDISQVKANSGAALTQATFRSDVTTNGSINASDVSAVKAASGAGTGSSGTDARERK